MKKTHLVYSTRKVKAKEKAATVAPPVVNDVEQTLEVGTTMLSATTVTRQNSANSRDGGNSRRRSQTQPKSKQRASMRLGDRHVMKLRPSTPLLQSEHVTVAQCVKSMVENKTEATLLVDRNGQLTGILTDRDIAVKVVALGRNPKVTRVSDVMTPNPHCVTSDASAIDALEKMVAGHFRHLPVADNDKVVGIIDIAKCLYEAIVEMEKDYNESSKNLAEAIKKLEKQMGGSARENLFEKLREKLFLPTLSAILEDHSPVPVLGPSATALDAALLMLAKRTSAVVVCNEGEDMVGIFTSKDLMRRVVALDIDPDQCMLSKVMTANPISARLNTTILETLHSMHNGQFLHVPVFGEDAKLVGLVNVLQATCAIVQQLGMFRMSKSDTETIQPLWNQLRRSFVRDEDSHGGEDAEEDTVLSLNESGEVPQLDQSELSASDRQRSWSSVKDEGPEANDPALSESPEVETPPPDVFVFKLADWNGANHRFTSSAESLKELIKDVQTRLGDHTIRKLHYVDEDGDHVLLFTDDDLKDAVRRARMWGNKYMRLLVVHRIPPAAAIAGASFFLSRRR
ncbi:hypothetical protein Poli38472_006062 [Pythium oligandrum]|uniref:CBS domain containing protein n=1 Tax=Pythium oligandrum TaxID=41045 RepID=A0A8K1FPQ0_PYTOL|nr:hypothetical protein Poli38472_006062 [Pythium oligandrum]|eukprot:TMW68594.1 hypothetical protein Poli38472_006062 [Pythium oligandrum]